MRDMGSNSKQVPHEQIRLSVADRALFGTLAVPRSGALFPEVAGAKRQFPGAPEGSFLAGYLNELSARPKKQRALVDLLVPLLKVERIRKGKAVESFDRREAIRAYARLKRKIDRKGPARLSTDGLVIPPESNEGKAALAALLLSGDSRLTRIRQCLRCGTWFYAHLERQLFCSDPEKRCQWNYYHSPEWRKKNRERNRKHQRAYRERLFGRRR